MVWRVQPQGNAGGSVVACEDPIDAASQSTAYVNERRPRHWSGLPPPPAEHHSSPSRIVLRFTHPITIWPSVQASLRLRIVKKSR